MYDEIVFVDPIEDVFREFLISSDKGCVPDGVRRRWNDDQESFAPPRDRVRIIDPLPHIGERLSGFRDNGVHVPGQISMAGFDDIPIVRDLVPPLTTVALPLGGAGLWPAWMSVP